MTGQALETPLDGTLDIGARMVRRADELSLIHDPGVNLSLWQRELHPAIAAEVSQLRTDALPDVRCRVDRDDTAAAVDRLLTENGVDIGRLSHWRADIVQIIKRFLTLSGAPHVMLRLETTRDDGCTRFHIDQTTLRLLCTYQGPGTEWLHAHQVDMNKLGTGAPNRELIRWGSPQRFPTGAVGVMRGSRYGTGLVHRSPPMRDEDRTRVLLCLDASSTSCR